ncbi:hypothetical protein SSP35_14_00840 [Streptomyces sp. NBRC 110611]|uniref:universal stress protein n=1 Tax=Streptomyces sp. NBRC 110611 TaxID=1621259 RepID=UPI0008554AD3|nr:universal stress protein [Streptomyces sp. NBRC 110611]GAU69750.1 hypothetical protein SSP35_14_00840 [Streptomyces sp. NBRC 110611]
MGDPVLVGLDGTENSTSAARWGAAEAAAQGLSLHLLHSWASQPLGIPIAHEAASKRRYGAEVLDRAKTLVRELYPGLAVTTEQVSDDAVDALVDRGRQATVTVLGSRGRGALAGFLLGSVSLHVLGRAECPVVTVRHEDASARAQPEVAVGVQDSGGQDETVLDFAFTSAHAHHAAVRAVRAWREPAMVGLVPTAPSRSPQDTEFAATERESLARAVAPWRMSSPMSRSPSR